MLKLSTKFVPARSAFQTAADAGFRFAEFWLDAGLLADWQAIARMAVEFPLRYALHFPNRGDLDDRSIDNAIALYQALDCSAMVIHQPMYRHYHQRLFDGDSTIRLAVENHRLSPNQLDQWADEHEWLTLDVEHLWMFTFPDSSLDIFLDRLQSIVTRIAGKLAHVHLPGYLPGYDEHRPMYSAREMVFPALSMFAVQKFDGFIVSEVAAEFQNPTELQMDRLLFERWRELRIDRPSDVMPSTNSQAPE